MRCPIPGKACARVSQLAAVIFLGVLTASAQNSNPTATPPASPDPQNAQALPDAPPPAPAQIQDKDAYPRLARRKSASESSSNGEYSDRPITVLEDTLMRLQTVTPVDTNSAKDGDGLLFLVDEDIKVDGRLAIPRGAAVHGTVVRSKRASTLTGTPELTLTLVSLELGGQTYPLYSSHLRVKGTSKTALTVRSAVGGAAMGALAGDINYLQNGGTSQKGELASMGKGAAVGAGVGTAVAAATPGPEIWIPAESEVEFSLASPITIVPVTAEEAARLAEGLNAGGPTLYVRGETP